MSVDKSPTQSVIEKRYRSIAARSAWLRIVVKLAVVVAIVAAVFSFVFGIIIPNDVGMDPAIKDSDVVLYYRLQDDIIAGDVVVYEANDDVYVGRVIATNSDTVNITESGELELNGHMQSGRDGIRTMPAVGGVEYPVTLGPNEYFILGDNRDASRDSREWGIVSGNDVEGKVFTILRRRNI